MEPLGGKFASSEGLQRAHGLSGRAATTPAVGSGEQGKGGPNLKALLPGIMKKIASDKY